MFFNEWHVLLVDDEPDVLSISKLVMRDFKVNGLPLKLHTATSKAEAVELLAEMPEFPALAVGFIDVVMESDTAGLELCQHIREERGNNLTQLFVRTGQPGLAPERQVIDNYDINGYFTKVEATEDKLYSLVKSGVRQYFWTRMGMTCAMLLGAMIENRGSRKAIARRLQGMFDLLGRSFGQPTGGWMVDDTLVAGINLDAAQATALRDSLDGKEGMPLDGPGDKFVEDGANMLIKVAAGETSSAVYLIARTTFIPPPPIRMMLYQPLKGLSELWYTAAE